MTKKSKLAKVPYNESGGLLDYARYDSDVHEWRDNKPFPALLTLKGAERGMSAARFVWHSDKGHIYKMFMTDMVSLIQNDGPIYAGTVDTWWIAQKRGSNYGIRCATQEDLKNAGHISGPKNDCPGCDQIAYRYESWCPLRPTADQPHQYRHDPLRQFQCLCRERMEHVAHGLT
ncbi:hypothetical protein [Streptomyces sp. cg35]|uniref:hypothetical protein n=1 Tax=Streptomyces sp. cg35 TaxID=3421650 RepID=UPI003D1695EC